MEDLSYSIFNNLQYWHWLVLAILLVILEIFSPAAFFVWMGAAAGVTGLALLALPDLSWQTQFIIFAVASIVLIILGRKFFNKKSMNTNDPTLSQLEMELIGNIYEVEQEIRNGKGRVKVGDTTWKVAGPDSRVGESVCVVDVKGAVLVVKPI